MPEREGPELEERTELDLGPSIDAAAAARDALRSRLVGVPEDIVEVACLLADELVANVLLHVGAPARLAIRRSAGSVRVEVSDSSPVRPMLRSLGPESLTGRGLHLLDELASSWGSTSHAEGKTVWFTLALA